MNENKKIKKTFDVWSGTTEQEQTTRTATEQVAEQINSAETESGITMSLAMQPTIKDDAAKPLLVPTQAIELLRTRKYTQRDLQQIKPYEKSLSFVIDEQTQSISTNLNYYALNILIGIMCELSNQSPYIEKYLDYSKGIKKKAKLENAAIAKENAKIVVKNKKTDKHQPIISDTTTDVPLTRANGFSVFGFPKEYLTDLNLEWLEKQGIEKDKPLAFIDIKKFVKKYFGIDISGGQYGNFRNIIATIGKTDMLYKDEKGVLHIEQLFTMKTAIYDESHTLNMVAVNKELFANFSHEYIKLIPNKIKCLDSTLELNFYCKLMEFYKLGYKQKKPIVKELDVKQLLSEIAPLKDIKQRRTKMLLEQLNSALQKMKDEKVLLEYSPSNVSSTKCKLVVKINQDMFVNNAEINTAE